MEINLSDYKNLDPNNMGSWPKLAKAGVILMICAAVLGLGYYFDTQEQQLQLEKASKLEITLKQEFEAKQAKAANLDAYKQQMKEMEESFGTMLRQLPSKTEVADLLVDITQTGLASGLNFSLFQPKNEIPQEFYAELPITLKVEGDYHQFGEFVSGVAALPRIVTLHDINISRTKDGSVLSMQATAKTYRYLEEEEMMALEKKKVGNKKKGRR
jgi:type IV pilus assembly protein PilO